MVVFGILGQALLFVATGFLIVLAAQTNKKWAQWY
jgi:hypothetical protein